MRFITSLLIPLFAAFAAASTILPRIETIPAGTIKAPISGTVPNLMWLLDFAPTDANLNSTGQIPDAIYFFGAYDIGNFGDPARGPLPPATLTMPDISDFTAGTDLFLAVVETAPFQTCPPGNNIPAKYGVTSTSWSLERLVV
ncbi:hypothetical protein B0H13DRAFT_2303107 [Mycena leptocephala]|nr:hypothetical protein B0H13DRAFT_2303107 [Mycena leptocephala]